MGFLSIRSRFALIVSQLFFLFLFHNFICAQSVVLDDTIQKPAKKQPVFYVAIDPIHMALGEWKLSIESQWRNKWSLELDAGYLNNMYSVVYLKYISYHTYQTFIDNKYFVSKNEGFGGNIGFKYYRKGSIQKGSFYTALIGYKNLKYNDAATHYGYYQSSSICEDCMVFEDIQSNVVSFKIGYGWQVHISKHLIASFFTHLGFKVVFNRSAINGIYYNVYTPDYINYSRFTNTKILFDNYHLNYNQYLPAIDFGVKLGWMN